MFSRSLAALAAGLVLCAPAWAQKPDSPVKPQAKAGPSEALLKTVVAENIALGDDVNVNDIPMFEMLQRISRRHGVAFVILEEQFRAVGTNDVKERKANFVVAKAKGMTLHRFLTLYLASLDARYLVRGDYLEVVPLTADAPARPDAGLVSLVVKEKPLNEVVEKLAEQYDLSVVIAPQSGDARTGFVTARLKNQPPEVALELLAVQCDLRVVRKGGAFLLTSRDHANELFNERLDRVRQKIEVEVLRQPLPFGFPPGPKPEPKVEPKQ